MMLPMINIQLEIDRTYTKEDLESLLHTNFGMQIKGITQRRSDQGEQFILLFSRATGPYTDRIEGTTLYYDGEGSNKDQYQTPANRALINASISELPIFGFRQDGEGQGWRYMGMLNVVDYSYFPKKGFMTYEFKLSIEPIAPTQLASEVVVLSKMVEVPPVLTNESELKKTTIISRARPAAFRIKVRHAYKNHCAICGLSRFSASGFPEVEAAHIFPKEKQGSDDPRNGLALCRLHHWAFDNGLIGVLDNYRIIVKDDLTNKDYGEITRYSGKSLFLPDDSAYHPHPLFLKAHREIHGFEIR
jgi:putative restriction endonuclease